ncbi:hypothetical protein GE061_016416 [Apolygus lucorum]|uniref:Uncharacterized protein n=1 Tax=Apolygus lucorum TaxID=248454 RepID=A0A8S9XG81_APOLU|nr:hypothetical protein GE061_016416 [Apolygus lucorum]
MYILDRASVQQYLLTGQFKNAVLRILSEAYSAHVVTTVELRSPQPRPWVQHFGIVEYLPTYFIQEEEGKKQSLQSSITPSSTGEQTDKYFNEEFIQREEEEGDMKLVIFLGVIALSAAYPLTEDDESLAEYDNLIIEHSGPKMTVRGNVRAGCHKGYCWADCWAVLQSGEWCYTTRSHSQSHTYVPCSADNQCNPNWKCGGPCSS